MIDVGNLQQGTAEPITWFTAFGGPGMIPPAFWLILGAIGVALVRHRGPLRDALLLGAPIVTILAIWNVGDDVMTTLPFLGHVLEPVEGSPERRLFASTFTAMAWIGGLFAIRQGSWQELACAYIYAAGAIGVSFAGDLLTLFLFWELMAIFSTFVIWCGGPMARSAGVRYAAIHFLGGVILKVGIIGLLMKTGSLDVVHLKADSVETWFIFIGVLINAAAPPVSSWLADAYPRASATGTVFLSAFTTKTAVLTLILLFPGERLLVWVGLYMAMYGIIWALLENDMRRILSYSVVNQVGFMVVAVGIGTETAIDGACAHAVAHIFYKALLFMAAGAVLYRTGLTRCTDLGGLFRTMPVTMACSIVGALSISSFPLTSGYTTKTLISVAALEEHMDVVYLMLAAGSAGVFLHAGIKFPWFVFFAKDSGMRPPPAPGNMMAAMYILAGLCLFLGIAPGFLYELLPYPIDYNPYKPAKVVYYLQLLLFGGLSFFALLPLMKRTETITLDTDWFWRAMLPKLWRVGTGVCYGIGGLGTATVSPAVRLIRWSSTSIFGESGRVGGPIPLSTTALWVLVLFTAYVVTYLV